MLSSRKRIIPRAYFPESVFAACGGTVFYMVKRSFLLTDYFNKLAADNKPQLSFKNAGLPFDKWHAVAENKLCELLGGFPEKVPLNAEVEYSVDEGDYIRQRVVFDADGYTSVPCAVLIPKGCKKDRKTPAVICCHGHGPFGKDPVSGVRSSPEYEAEIKRQNYNYAEQMARAGFVTLSPDLRGFGERRDDTSKLNGRDLCNVNFLKGALFGVYTLTLNIWDIRRCVDYLCAIDEINPERIGLMGLSYGGTVTAFTAAVEPRIKAADIIGYINPFAGFAVQRGNFCGSQIVPGLYKYFDTFDIAGLIAPRPCLLEMGIYDNCFFFEDLYKGYTETLGIYKAAGAEDKLFTDIHPHGHAFSGKCAFDFFRENL